ncbi:MAG: hypothetical protein ACR2QC_00110 [Gammaproteobacteria bacterium]
MSHSCEGRNLRRRIAAGNCTLLQFAPSARRFLPSQEWDGGVLWNKGGNPKCRHSGENRNLFARKRKQKIRLAANEIPAFAGMA